MALNRKYVNPLISNRAMKMRIGQFVSLIASVLMLSACSSQTRPPSASVGTQAASELKLCNTCLQLCSSCHYANGTSAGPEFPKIAGQKDTYLVKAVVDFKEGKRDSETMQAIAKLHTKEEMIKLARYFASLQPANAPSISAPDETLWEWGKIIYEQDRIYGISCADCHGHNGMGYTYESPKMRNVRAIPRLAGQSRVYLASAVQRYVDGKYDTGMCTMRRAGQTLSPDDVNALVEYLASLTPPGS
jgi:cytochrome c553